MARRRDELLRFKNSVLRCRYCIHLSSSSTCRSHCLRSCDQTEEREQKGPVENQSVLKLKTKIPHQIKIRKNFPRRVSTVSFLFCIHVNHTTSDMGQKPSIRLLRNAQGPPKKGPWGSLKKGLNGYDREMCDAWNGELDTLLTFVRASCYSRSTTNTKLA